MAESEPVTQKLGVDNCYPFTALLDGSDNNGTTSSEKPTEESYICDVCGLNFSCRTYLIKHYKKVHAEVNPEHQQCPKCSMVFKKYDTFWEHVIRVHENPGLSTETKDSFKVATSSNYRSDAASNEQTLTLPSNIPETEEELEKLVDSYISEENGLRCKLCNNDKLYCGKANTRRHIREVHLKGYLNLQHKRRASCNICDKTFANNTVLNTHMRNIHIQPEPTLPCPKCWKKFKMVKALRRHLQDVHQVSADIKQLKTNLGVDSHSSAGTSLTTSPEYNDDEFDPIFTCDDCKLSFVTTEALNRHNKVIHPKKLKLPTIIPAERKLSVKLLGPSEESTEPEIKCPECDKRFPNKSALSGHSVVHKKANLEPHIKTMLKAVFGAVCNSTLICSLCGIEVANSLEGRLHVYIKHPDKYNELVTTMAKSTQGYLQCAHCPDKLPCPEAMLNHIESQHPTKYIPTCNVCGHKELKERDLNHHFKQEHPNVSRYICNVCERSFNQKRDLEHHVSRSHSVNAVQCPYCPEKLVKVKLHVTIKHPEKAEEFTEMRKAAIREEQVERMRFNQFLVRGEVTDNPDGRVRNSKTIRMRSKAGKRKARKCSESEKESSTEDDNFDPVDRKPNVCFLKETEKFIVPETYTLEKHTTNHLIEVHRVPPPIPPKAPESILIEREFGLPENVVDNEVDVKPDVSQLAELRSNLDTNCSITGTVRKPSRRKSGRR